MLAGALLTLQGEGAYDAAVHCAAISAAKRVAAAVAAAAAAATSSSTSQPDEASRPALGNHGSGAGPVAGSSPSAPGAAPTRGGRVIGADGGGGGGFRMLGLFARSEPSESPSAAVAAGGGGRLRHHGPLYGSGEYDGLPIAGPVNPPAFPLPLPQQQGPRPPRINGGGRRDAWHAETQRRRRGGGLFGDYRAPVEAANLDLGLGARGLGGDGPNARQGGVPAVVRALRTGTDGGSDGSPFDQEADDVEQDGSGWMSRMVRGLGGFCSTLRDMFSIPQPHHG